MGRSRKTDPVRLRFALFSLLSISVLCFIFSQSMLSGEVSGGLSQRVAAFLKPILDPMGSWSDDAFHYFIRKCAHFSEFAVLGMCVCGATVNLGTIRGKRYIALPALITLLSAVGDEFLQHFTGRGSAVTDVVIDFCGALSGIGIFVLILFLLRRFYK